MQKDYIERTYAGWLGKIIGIRLGSPIEGWPYAQIKKTYGTITDYLVDYEDYAADDDSNGPLFFVRALLDYGTDLNTLTPEMMGKTWLNYAAENHGFYWWGGYGISTEHTAYMNMKHGIKAPKSGSIEQNGRACAEQIGGQIFSDCWGFVAPNQPKLAADYAGMMSSVSHDGDGINGGRFVAAGISTAYHAKSVEEILEGGLSVIPATSGYARIVRDIMRFHKEDTEKNWEHCYHYIAEHYGYDKFPGICHILPNAAVMILSMLYGEGDFTKTQCICNMCGWDTDCNAGNVGAIIGTYVGIEGIEDRWIQPIGDRIIASSVIGSMNQTTIAKTTQIFCALGYEIAGEEPEDKWPKRFQKRGVQLDFDLPKSTQGIRLDYDKALQGVWMDNMQDVLEKGRGSLVVGFTPIAHDYSLRLYYRTYYQPKDLHDSRYDPAFSPAVYPGQTVYGQLYYPGQSPMEARITVTDSNNKRVYKSEPIMLQRGYNNMEYTIPSIESGLIRDIGITVTGTTNPTGGLYEAHTLHLVDLWVDGQPNYSVHFENECIEDYGFGHCTLHKEISQFTYTCGLWEFDGECLSGSCTDYGDVFTGAYYMEDYQVAADIIPQTGAYHLLSFRVQGAIRSYAVGFYGEGQIALLKKDLEYEVLASKDYTYEQNRAYRFLVKAEGNRIRAYMNEELLFDVEDDGYTYGQVGFSLLDGSHGHFRHLEVRPL